MLGIVFWRNLDDGHTLGALQNLEGVGDGHSFGVDDFVFFGGDDDLTVGFCPEPRDKNSRKSRPRGWVFQSGENINDPARRHWAFGQLDTAAELNTVLCKRLREGHGTIFKHMDRKG